MPMEDGQVPALREAYWQLEENAYWCWLQQELAEKRHYLVARLSECKSWEECCRLQGELVTLRGICGLMAEGALPEEPVVKR